MQDLIPAPSCFLRSQAGPATFCETRTVCRLTKWELLRLWNIYVMDQSPDFFEKYSYMVNDFCSSEIKLLVKLYWRATSKLPATSVRQNPFLTWTFKAAVLQLTNCRLSEQAPKLFCYFRAQYHPVELLIWSSWVALVWFLLFIANKPVSQLELLTEGSRQKKYGE